MKKFALSTTIFVMLARLVIEQSIAAEDVVTTEWPTQSQVWTSENGFSVKAKLMSIGKQVVILKKESGKDIEVLITHLSERDRHYVERIRREAQSRFDSLIRQAWRAEEELPLVELQKLLEEIKEIKMQGSTARNSLSPEEEMSKLDKRYGIFKVKFAFPVKDVDRDGLYRLRLGGDVFDHYLMTFRDGVMVNGTPPNHTQIIGPRPYSPNVTKQEMLEIGQGTHQYEVVCEMRASDLSHIVDGGSSPPVKLANCQLVKVTAEMATKKMAVKRKEKEAEMAADTEMAARRVRAAALSVQKRQSIGARLNARRTANSAAMRRNFQNAVDR